MNMRGSTAGLVMNPKMSFHEILLELLDTIFATIILAPLIVGYWRGTWDLMEVYLFRGEKPASQIASLVIGIIGHLVFTIFQDAFKKYLNRDKHRLIFYVGSRLYTYIYGIICVNGWRGGWQLLDHYTTHDVTYVMLITLVCALILACLKSLRNITASPFVLVNDRSQEYFDVRTMFKLSGSREPGLYVLDCLFSVLVIGSLVVFVWRGLWVLLDLRLFPHDPALSAWGSLIIGYGVVGVTFALQPIMRWACDRLEGFWRVAVADVFLFFSFIGTVNVWRGVWQLLDIYFLPENRFLSDWLTHGVSILLLVLLNCSNSVLVRGVYIDAEEPAGQCVVFPVYYIRLFFQKERTKKQKRLIEALDRQDQNNTIVLLEKPKYNAKILNNNKQIRTTENSEEISLTKIDDLENSNEKHHHTIICTTET